MCDGLIVNMFLTITFEGNKNLFIWNFKRSTIYKLRTIVQFSYQNWGISSLPTASKNLYCKMYDIAKENNPLLLFSNSSVQIFCSPPPIEIFILPIFKGHSSSDVLFRIGCTCIIIVYSRSKSIIAKQMGFYSFVQLYTYF